MVETTAAASNDHGFSLLPDPCTDRHSKDSECLILANKPLDDDKFFGKDGLPDWKMLKEFLSREGPVTKP